MSLEVRDVSIEPKDERLKVAIKVTNAADRTVHAYATVRRIVYDEATHQLELDLSDEETRATPTAGTFVFPRFKAIDPNRDGEIRLDLPRVLNRMAAGENQVSPTIESVPLDDVRQVDVRLAWSDTPFYDDVRDESKPVVHQLVDWKKGIARAKIEVKPPRRPRRGRGGQAVR